MKRLVARVFLIAMTFAACDDGSPATDASAGGDATTTTDVNASETGASDGSVADVITDADAGGLPLSFFGLTIAVLGDAHAPTVPFGALRLWDTTAVWPNINPDAGLYDWTALDAWLAEAAKANVDVIFTFGRTPTWASARKNESCGYGVGCAAPPSDLDGGDAILKSFVTAIVNHSLQSATHIKYYEIWNEPDLKITWSGTADELVRMGKDIFETVHALDPDAIVIGPSPSTGNPFGIHFLPSYYEAGGAPYDDIVGMHAYLYTGASFATVPEGAQDTITQLEALMNAYDAGDKPIFFTEGSWGGAPTNATMTDDERVAYLARDYLIMWMNGVARFYWYGWDNTGWGTLWDGGITPPGKAYATLEDWLVGSTHAPNPCTKDGSGTWTCMLVRANAQPAMIAWNATSTHSLSVPSAFHTYVTIDDPTPAPVANGTVTVSGKPLMLTAQ